MAPAEEDSLTVIGVDPGIHGAIVRLPTKGKPQAWVMPMKGKQRANDYDMESIVALMRDFALERTLLVVEHVTRPASIVRCRALFEAIAYMLDMPYTLVTPMVWKKHFALGRDKAESIDLAQRMFPTLAPIITRKKDDGLAEAALIAAWGRERVGGTY